MKAANILAIALLNTAFVALPATSAGAQETITVEGDKAKKTCRRESVVGSNFTRRLCLTYDEWKARDRAQSEYKSKMQHGADSQGTQMEQQIQETGGGG